MQGSVYKSNRLWQKTSIWLHRQRQVIYAPPPEKNGALRLLGLNFNSLQVGNENQVSKVVLASCRKPSHRRRIPPAGVDLLLSHRPLTGVERKREHEHSQALAWSFEHDKS